MKRPNQNQERKKASWPFYLLGLGLISMLLVLAQMKGLLPIHRLMNTPENTAVVEAEYCSATINSEPVGSMIYINGLFVGNSPTTTRVECSKPLFLSLEHQGFNQLSATVRFTEKANQLNYRLVPIAPVIPVDPVPPVTITKPPPPAPVETKSRPAPREAQPPANFSISSITLKSPTNAEEFFEGEEALAIPFAWRAKPIPKEQDYFYVLEIADGPEFKKKLLNQRTKSNSIGKQPLALSPGKYYWRVLLVKGRNTIVETSPPSHFIYRERPLPLPPNTKVRLIPGSNPQ